jgi:hypothetical protein
MDSEKATCSCGKLVLIYDDIITRTSICHCRACKKRTGSAFGVQVRLNKENVSIQGEAKQFDRATDAGAPVHFYFCPNCGSNVYWEIDAMPDSIIAPAGAFENHQLPPPSFSFYEDCMLAWVRLPDSVKVHK